MAHGSITVLVVLSISAAGCGATSASPSSAAALGSAPDADVHVETGSEPRGTGGDIADGTYYLTAVQEYAFPPWQGTLRMVLTVKGSAYDLAWKAHGPGSSPTDPDSASAAGTLAAAGVVVKFLPTTGFDFWKLGHYEFIATPTSFELHVAEVGDDGFVRGEVYFFTKQ
jgi:hypothetical protein